ncbi:hypothetical protein CI109_105133 [Kwoniella shandongensis]|uniref:Uncharacterized protein n=1 Tax=Kwoniella shandongensis TaxID=1734106 RepID=A0A5M6C327_9TREE|nr:uncharacterized protein CI109_001972 [Kwoniella shandongensis]KAA5529547.1 hypothetical protein CI109_001972 [Kwoniella shandongensis]
MPSPATPPISPTPRRWRSPTQEPLPEFAALLSSFEGETASDESSSRGGSMPRWATPHGRTEDEDQATRRDEEEEAEVDSFLTAASSIDDRAPEIRTTSPSPKRAGTDRSLSPLLPPNRGQLFGEDADTTIGRSGLSRTTGSRGSLMGPREPYRPQQPFLDTPPTEEMQSGQFTSTIDQYPIPPQTTGQSTATIDAAYDGVFSQLDALANPTAIVQNTPKSSPSTPTRSSTTNEGSSPAALNIFHPMPIRQPLVGLGINPWGSGDHTISRLSTVTERTERSNTSAGSSPTIPGAYRDSTQSDFSITSIANRFPLPSSPVKGPRPPGGTPQGTPKKTSDLIKMFESRSGGSAEAPPAQPQFTPTTPSQPHPPQSQLPSSAGGPQPLQSIFSPPQPSSVAGITAQSPNEPRYTTPTPPPKSTSPLSQVRTMIASWRARSGSPSQRVIGSPGKGGSSPRLFSRGGDRGWNVSIRRRKRNERELAEQAEETNEGDRETPQGDELKEDEAARQEYEATSHHGDEEGAPSRSASVKSDKQTTSEPRQLTGEPLRTGALYYLNVHDDETKPDYVWVRADGRLYPEGLDLTWISAKGRATVTLDLEFCDEVASTYSPNNPMAGDDIGAAAARRQGELADNLYPFKLVYDDGVERLACDSARERVRWVNAIWTVLERSRAVPTADRSGSLRVNRSNSEHGSEGGGSASTHFTPADQNQPLPSPHAPHSHPLYTTDDAVIETSGGLHAPIVQRGSRRLAAGGLERGRSLRRVASEADLRDSASTPPPLPEKDERSPATTTAIHDTPLTAGNASRPTSRDFTFAHGIKPPILQSDTVLSPSKGMSAFRTATGAATTPVLAYHSLESASTYHTASPSGTVQPLSGTSTTVYTARMGGPRGTTASMYSAQSTSQITAVTARDFASSSNYTARQSAAITAHSVTASETGHTAPPGSATLNSTAQQFSSSDSAYTAKPPATDYGTAQTFSPSASSSTARPDSQTPMGTAQPWPSSTSMYSAENARNLTKTAHVAGSPAFTGQTAVPNLAITGGSPTHSQSAKSTYTTAYASTSGLTAPNQAVTSSQAYTSQYHQDASVYATAQSALGTQSQPELPTSDRPASRLSRVSGSSQSYETAPPPVPSRDSHYSTASLGPPSTRYSAGSPVSPTKYQLHDPPVPTFEQSFRGLNAGSYNADFDGDKHSSHVTVQQPVTEVYHAQVAQDRSPTTRWTTATTDARWSTAMATAQTVATRSPNSSEWETAPPPPISRSVSSDDLASTRLTDGLGTRRGSRAWTQVSHPDSDDEFLADLERRSSTGSTVSRRPKSKKSMYASGVTTAQTMWTAQTMGDSRSGRTPLGTARENTLYTDARTSAYTTAPTWHSQSTYMATAPGATSYHDSRSSHATPIRGEAPSADKAPSIKPQSISTASSVPPSTKKIPRIPPPGLPPPSPSFPSSTIGCSEPSSSSSFSSTETIHAQRGVDGYDVNRILNFLQGQEQAKQGQTTRIGSQLDRIERKVIQIAENQAALADRERPPPVPSKDLDDESPPSSPSSSTSSIETARPVTPPPVIMPEVMNSQFDDLRSLLGNIIGRQEDMAQELARRRSYDVELPDRGPGMTRLENMLRRLLERVGDSDYLDVLSGPVPDEKRAYHMSHLSTPKPQGTKDGSMYGGGDSVYSGEFGSRGRHAPANSFTSDYDRRRRGPLTDVSDSLIDGQLAEPEFDENFALSGLPPDTPPGEYVPRHPQVPAQLTRRAPPAQPAEQPAPQSQPEEPQYEEYYQDDAPEPASVAEEEVPITEYEPTPQPTPVPPPKEVTPEQSPDQPPIPYRTEDDYDDEDRTYEEETYPRGPSRPGPPPQPVDLPTPVNSLRNMPQYQQQGQYPMRPPFPVGGMPPPGPGMTDMPRPSLPRIAGVRDPISTTYFRRGFPPGPMGMGPMGMFPGPMGIPGPGMGPFMPGLRPGMPGFGGPMGPNVNPSLRRPGFFPPGVTSTTGDYGLPAGARYGNAGLPPSSGVPGRPPMEGSGHTTTADTGLGNTTSESTASTPSVLTEEIVTPVAATTHVPEPVEVSATPALSVSGQTDDSFRRALGNNQALAAAQGEQQNEMSRYLHGMSDQIADGTLAAQNQLAEIMGDIAALREQLKPKHIHAHVLPDGTVMLDNGHILDGIRGVPAPVPAGAPPPPVPPKSASHVEGKILPDGTVMANGKIVDGIKGAPTIATPATPAMMVDEPTEEQLKNMEQDRKLAELQDKIAELMQRTQPTFEEEEIISYKADTGSPPANHTPMAMHDAPLGTHEIGPTAVGPNTDVTREKTIIKEREVVREGPFGRHKEVQTAQEINRDMVTEVPPAGSVPVPATVAPGSTGMADVPVTATGISHDPPSTVPPGSKIPTNATAPPTVAPTRINPRTGKPLTIPTALSTHSMSPIRSEYNYGDPSAPQLIREEHEEIVQRPGGGPPVHTHTTTRTYTQHPSNGLGGSVPPGTGLRDPSAAGDMPATVFADVPGHPGTVPGSHHSEHIATSQHGAANLPSHRSDYIDEVVAPGGVPVDARISSVAHTQRPAATVADPAGGSAAVPSSAGAPPPAATAANVPSTKGPGSAKAPASVWSTNHPRSNAPAQDQATLDAPSQPPANTAHNVPTAPGTNAAPSATAHDAPSAPAGAAGASAPAGPPPAAVAGDAPPGAAAPQSGSSKSKPSVHWEKMIPHKEVSSPKGRQAQGATPADPAGPPATTQHNVPSQPDPAVKGDPSGKVPVDNAHDATTSPVAAPASTAHDGKATSETPHSGSGTLRRSKSKDNSKANSTTQPDAGVPLVPADTVSHSDHATVGQPIPTAASDKNTRVADTAHVSRPPTVAELAEEGGDFTAQPGGQTVHVPSHPIGTSSRLKKKPVPGYVEGDMTDPKEVAQHASAPAVPTRPASVAPVAPSVPILEEIVLPDGRTAYVQSRPSSSKAADQSAPPPPGAQQPGKLKKGKGGSGAAKEGPSASLHDANTQIHVPAELEMGKGHCSVCCPHGIQKGVPAEPCGHQDGQHNAAPAAPQASGSGAQMSGPRTQKPNNKLSRPPSVRPLGLPEAEGISGPGEEVALEHDGGAFEAGASAGAKKADPSNKLTKGKKGGNLTPEEEAMEDARKLAVKQKAAAEQAAAEKADRDAKHQEKEKKAKLAEERHRQNVEALANLQKMLDLLATDNKTAKTLQDESAKSQEKRRADKSVRDKKITEALDKLVAEREEAKKKQAADDKKPGTQAILDALKTSGDSQAAFLRKLATEMMDNNSSQHQKTQQAMKETAREQVGFNLAGYLDDFSKALSGEVRTLLKEVGDLRESRRALYMELAELLLMKGRQSAGDLMAILPYPAAPPQNAQQKQQQQQQNQQKKGGENKDQNKAPAWTTWAPMGVPPPVMGRPLPQPGMPPPMHMNLSGGAVPPPPPPGGRPLPKV